MNFKKIPIDSKAAENYFGHFSQQLKAKGGVAFQPIIRLVFKLIDKAFAKEAECMLKDKKLKAKHKEVAEIKTDWSRAQKDLMKSKLALTDPEADKLAREQSKNKAMALCQDNGKKHMLHRCYN